MAKTRRKAEVAGGSQMELLSSDDKIAEVTPSEIAIIKEAEANIVIGNSEELEERKKTEDGLNEPGNDKNEVEDENEEEDESEEEDENEGDEYEDAEAAAGNLATKEEENKEDGKVERLVDNVVTESEKAENENVDDEKEVKDSSKVENTPIKMAKRSRRRKRKTATNAAPSKDNENSEKLQNADKNETLTENEIVDDEKVANDSTKVENTPIKRVKRSKKRKRKTATNAAPSKDNENSEKLQNAKKEALAVKNEAKMADGMGLIFMCNAKTKQDCFRYKVLGLPAGKKELVAKIYKGMRLFLFDVDLKLLYGIFKAATPGGYNLEPKAFKSAFPAQVRFSVLNDCLPLPEQKFKSALKGNYYGRNKFNNQLSQEQVKSLCKLFRTANKITKKERAGDLSIEAEPEPTPPSKRRRRITDVRAVRAEPIPRSLGQDHRKTREANRAKPVRTSSSAHKRSRHERERQHSPLRPPPSRRDREVYLRQREAYDPWRGQDMNLYPRQEVYASPPRTALPPPAPAASYDYFYRRDPPLGALLPSVSMVDPRDHHIYSASMVDPRDHHMYRAADLDRQPLPREPPVTDYRDAYSLYREPHALYSDPLYASSLAAPAAYAAAPAAYGTAPAAYSAAPAAYGTAPAAAPAAPAAYAPTTASMAPTAYAPPSLYHRY